MNAQRQFDFTKPLQPEAKAGMVRALDNSDERWREEISACVRTVALAKEFFSADDVYAELERNHFHFSTHNTGALGPRLKEIAKTLAYMEATDQVVRSKRPASHGNLHRVWRSLIFRIGAK